MRLIDAELLLDEVGSLEQVARKRECDTPTNSPVYERYATQMTERKRFMSIIIAQPSIDAVEVVRCEDCKESENCHYTLLWCNRIEDFVPPKGFCHRGERREK